MRDAVAARRDRIRHRRTLNTTYRCVLGTVGAIVLVVGIVMVPYPGPGWLVVFAGLGILATEFHWAHRVNAFAKRHYQRWVHWLARQRAITKIGVMSGTAAVVGVTLWMMGVFDLVGGWFGMHMTWLASPLFGS
ncbi:TIGR02611 family protein [Saccharopolyspora sp. HNM0983]|uniref:TIGR02611 family protein n=2 Tax=Saccharopolyspora montiporae TaxID=2781240 RepID=A0A929B4X9_9PSEU|nr:TIGR02611 family protein [Saccharopolyspora sp. HNM0983]